VTGDRPDSPTDDQCVAEHAVKLNLCYPILLLYVYRRTGGGEWAIIAEHVQIPPTGQWVDDTVEYELARWIGDDEFNEGTAFLRNFAANTCSSCLITPAASPRPSSAARASATCPVPLARYLR